MKMRNISDAFDSLRWGYLGLTRGMRFSHTLMRQLYKQYIGHGKIIAWYKGYPMFTTFSPPSLSPVIATKIATFILQGLQQQPRPHMVDIALTDVCNSNCEHCSFYINVGGKGNRANVFSSKRPRTVLSTAEVKNLIDDCVRMGVTAINFVGGEPLLREDILEIIKHIDQDMAISGLFTNGWYLAERAKDLKTAGLTTVRVSLDSALEDVHDRKRNHPGLFKRAIDGLKEAKKVGLITAISCCLSPAELKDGTLVKLIELGKRLKVNEILVLDALPSGRYEAKEIEQLNLKALIDLIKPFNEDSRYPGIVCYAYVRSYMSLGCTGGTSFFYVSPYGDVCPCDFDHSSVGNVREQPLHALWNRFRERKDNICKLCPALLMQ